MLALWQSIAAGLIFVVTVLLIMTRPRGLPEWVVAVGGAAAMVLLGIVAPLQAGEVLGSEWDVFLFFLGLMSIAAVADRAGFFDWTAAIAVKAANGKGRRLFLNVFVLGTLISAFLSNDATALILTPIVYSLTTRLRLNPLPFMFACTFVADTASFILPVSNPINILVLGTFPESLPNFLKHLLLPSVLCVGLNLLAFLWIFRRDLPRTFEPNIATPGQSITDRPFFTLAAVGLGLVAVGYVVASLLRVYLSLVAIAGAGLLVVGGLAMGRLSLPKLSREISWSLFPFIGGMFVVVKGVENIGLTRAIGGWIAASAGQSVLLGVLITTFGTALGANLINNVPMTLVMISTISQLGSLTPNVKTGLVYATIFGADLGPNLTTLGSLATVLWLLILRRKGLEITSVQYFKVGIIVTPIMLLIGALAIWLSIVL